MPESNTLSTPQQSVINAGIELLQAAGLDFHTRGWSLATSSNYSMVVNTAPLVLLMTASGKDKGKLRLNDFVLVDENINVIRAAHDTGASEALKPSAEAALHITIAEEFAAGSILHTHSVWSTVLSERHAGEGSLSIRGLEMLKALAGITTHDTSISIPIFENNQDMNAVAALVKK